MFEPGRRGVLRYVNAGHNPQYVLRSDGRLEQMSSSRSAGRAAGRPRLRRGSASSSRAGDLLFFYTDGCVEAENETGEMFGTERLEALLVRPPGRRRRSPRRASRRASRRSAATREPFDDATMMVVSVG